jgi:hypothetical protein
MDPRQVAALAALANGIIPADDVDAGAREVGAAAILAQRIDAGVNAKVYLDGLRLAEAVSVQRFGAPVESISGEQVHQLLGLLRAEMPGFFKQLRMDVCALYLSDPAVWERIGFPGPSTETGGYPDFHLPQIKIGRST